MCAFTWVTYVANLVCIIGQYVLVCLVSLRVGCG